MSRPTPYDFKKQSIDAYCQPDTLERVDRLLENYTYCFTTQ